MPISRIKGDEISPALNIIPELYTTTLISDEKVIPAKAGIQKDTGFRIKCGMTDSLTIMSLCINVIPACLESFFVLSNKSEGLRTSRNDKKGKCDQLQGLEIIR